MSCGCPTPSPLVPTPPAFPAFPPATSAAVVPSPTSPISPTNTDACPDYLTAPKVFQLFTVPAVNSTGQFYSQCAYLWAVPGATLYLPPMGLVEILGVSGNLITYRNVNIAVGTNINAGTILIIGAPQAASNSVQAVQLDRLRGFLNGSDSYLVGSANQIMRWNTVGSSPVLQATSGMLFYPNASFPSETSAEDVGGAALNTTPIATAGTGVTAYYDLPNLPAANLLPTTFWVKLRIRLSVAAIDNTVANAFTVKHNGIEVMNMTYKFVDNLELTLPSQTTQLVLEYTKFLAKANCFARVYIVGYYF